MAEEEKDLVLNCILTGDANVGKSCILLRYTEGTFSESPVASIGCEYKSKSSDFHGTRILTQVWDTAGQERFRTISGSLYKTSQVIGVVFDVTDASSFANVTSWIKEVNQFAAKGITLFLIANKIDLGEARVVSEADAKAFAKECNATYMETSAKDGFNIEELFNEMLIQTECSRLGKSREELTSLKRKSNGSRRRDSKKKSTSESHHDIAAKENEGSCCVLS